jgi:hypothetical protein
VKSRPHHTFPRNSLFVSLMFSLDIVRRGADEFSGVHVNCDRGASIEEIYYCNGSMKTDDMTDE